MQAESIWAVKSALPRPEWRISRKSSFSQHQYSSIRASESMENKNKVYKELGLFSLRKKIEDAVVRAETMAPNALELEEAKQIEQEEMVKTYKLWEDPSKSDEILTALAESVKVVDALKDIRFKVEEAKLITQLADMDVINYRLFKQAYKASLDVGKFLDHYEMSKLLTGLYDMEGACVIISAGSEATDAEFWAERLLNMYKKWGDRVGRKGRITEKCLSNPGGIRSAIIEFESKFAYGYLSGERGMHQMITKSLDGSVFSQNSVAGVDIIPLFLQSAPDLQVDDQDMEISLVPPCGDEPLSNNTHPAVRVCHIPTGINVQCSGERNHFANKMKAVNRLKAKLLVVASDQGVFEVKKINKTAISDICKQETRRYMFHPCKLVHDVKTGIQMPDLTSILDGNLEALLAAHLSIRQTGG